LGEVTSGEGPVEKKRWKVTFEVEATVRELSDEVVREAANRYSNSDEILSSREHSELVEHQRRLLSALRADRSPLEQWMWGQVLVLFEGNDAYRRLEGANDDGTDSTTALIFRALEALPAEDRRFFEEMEAAGVLYENTEELSECFGSRIVRVDVEDLDRP
jgi:hypothetical protein